MLDSALLCSSRLLNTLCVTISERWHHRQCLHAWVRGGVPLLVGGVGSGALVLAALIGASAMLQVGGGASTLLAVNGSAPLVLGGGVSASLATSGGSALLAGAAAGAPSPAGAGLSVAAGAGATADGCAWSSMIIGRSSGPALSWLEAPVEASLAPRDTAVPSGGADGAHAAGGGSTGGCKYGV